MRASKFDPSFQQFGVSDTPWVSERCVRFQWSGKRRWAQRRRSVGPAPLQKCVGVFVVHILEDFAGDFPGGFFWAIFPTQKRGEKIRRQKPRKKTGGPKIKVHEKSILPKTDPKIREDRHLTNPGTTPITILAVNSDHGLSFAGEETRTMV